LRIVGTPTVVPAGPKTIKVLDKWGRRTVDKVVGYAAQPYVKVYTDHGMRFLEIKDFTVG